MNYTSRKEKLSKKNRFEGQNLKHNRLSFGRIALVQLVGALIICSLFRSGGGRGEPKWEWD